MSTATVSIGCTPPDSCVHPAAGRVGWYWVYRLCGCPEQSGRSASVATANGWGRQASGAADTTTAHQREERAVGWFSDNRKPAMTSEERALRDRAEAVVLQGLKAVAAVREAGKALHTLKSRDLWRDTHDSWQTYTQERFGISARRAHQLVEFSQFTEAVAEAIGTSGTAVTLSERALRPLADVPAEQVSEAIAEAVAASGGGEPTPAAIRAAASKRKRKTKSRKAKPTKPLTIRVAGAKVTISPTHAEPVFRGFRETLVAALEKLAQGDREAA